MIDDKTTLTHQRTALVESLLTPLSAQERIRVQGELSLINAKIKAQNTTLAAQLKAAADQRKVSGLLEAQANAARAQGRTPRVPDPSTPATATDAWIDAVLLHHDIDFTRTAAGKISLNVQRFTAL